MFALFEIWFYVSSYMEYGGILEKPSVATGVVWLIYLIDVVVASVLAKIFLNTLDNNSLFILYISLLFFSFIPGYFILYHYFTKKNRGLKILIRYRHRIKKKRYVVLIWFFYFCIIIPGVCMAIMLL